MKFRLAGNQQPPDWVLAEADILINLESIDTLSQLCRTLCKHILRSPSAKRGLDERNGDGGQGESLMQEVTRLGAWSSSDGKVVAALLRYIFTNCAKYKLTDETVKRELGQLGFAPDQCEVIVQVFREFSGKLRRKLIDASFLHLRLDTREPIDWRVDYILQSSQVEEVNEQIVRLSLPLRQQPENTLSQQNQHPTANQTSQPLAFDVSKSKFNVLVHELQQAQQLMKQTAAKLK